MENSRDALDLVSRLAGKWRLLFTVRLRSQGGSYEGEEGGRLEMYRQALARGAVLLDAELDSGAAGTLAREGAPLIVSHHDFGAMVDDAALESLTARMAALRPRALKIVPTARTPADGVRMLEWTRRGGDGETRRIGFAMGEMGLPSRVLSLAWGSPLTYAAWGMPVAPGQISVGEMKGLYRAGSLGQGTRVFGVIGNPVAHSLSPRLHNPAFASRGLDAVYLPIRLDSFADVPPILDPLRVDGLSVTIPFKEDALRFASRPDERSLSSGAANTLVFQRESAGRRVALGFNTDFDGVLGPLTRRRVPLRGLQVGILGAGGAARGAARALRDAGAAVTLYFRNRERGKPVAEALGVPSKLLGELSPASHGLLINATPLGLHPGDPSPAPASVFKESTIAFDMVYGSAETPFLAAARSAGAQVIPGHEMLICQGLVQFRLFTGREATYEEFEATLKEVGERLADSG
jgi:3-dehydroquinate dehydratase/shikimate dehydrogenase